MIITLTLNPSLDEWVYLPRLRLGQLNRAVRFLRYPGGKGINVSRVVHELGEKTLAVALAGGSDGRILDDLLTRRRLPHRFVHVPGSTRNNYEIRTQSPDVLTQINCPGPRVPAGTLDTVEGLLCRLRPRPLCAVLSGSLPPGLPSHVYERLIRRLNRLGILTVLDASGQALRDGLRAKPWLIKPNRAEAEELLGRRLRRMTDVAGAAKQLVSRGPSVAIVSLGADGAVMAARTEDTQEVLRATAPPVRSDSTVGAGDSLVAGFLVGWLRTRSFREAFRLGIACGTATAITPGTELCHRKDVKRLEPRVAIQPMPTRHTSLVAVR